MSEDQNNIDLHLPGEFATRFEVREKIGAGGTGTVYKAWDVSLKRWVALKVLNSDKLSEKNIARLHKEAKTICQLKHQNIVDIYDFLLTEKNQPVLAMQFIDGVPLENIIEEHGALDMREAVDIFLQICSAMSYAHSRGILHRDLTPSNILVTKNEKGDRQIKVVDFGVARMETVQEKTLAGFLTIAGSGQLVGTVTVISPEQARGKTTDARSDVYSLGCLMFRALTGQYPFLGENYIETAQMQINKEAPSLSEKNVDLRYPKDLERIIARALQKVPADRFQSMDEVKAAVEELITIMSDPTSNQMRDLVGVADAETFKKSGNWHIKATVGVLALVLLAWCTFSYFNQTKPEEQSKEQYSFVQHNEHIWFQAKGMFGPESLSALATRPVERISLKGTTFTDDALEALCKQHLLMLDVRDTNITDQSLAIIAKCKSLRTLLLNRCPNITDKGCVRCFAGLDNLIICAMDDTAIGDNAVIAACRHDLRLLHLTNCSNVTDKSVPSILSRKHLNSLRLGGTHISKKSATEFLRMKSLGFLGLFGFDLNDEDFPNDASPRLSRIDLSNNNWTVKIIDKLERKLPNLYFIRIEHCPGLSDQVLKEYRDRHGKGGIEKTERFIVLPIDEVYNVSLDTEGYFEPTLYDFAGDDESKIRVKLTKWDRAKWQSQLENGYTTDFVQDKSE